MAKILIIDDDPLFCEMLAEMAGDLKHQASSCTHLDRGVQMARGADADIVFLDVHMPDGNGLDSIPAIKRVPSEPEIIIVTGLGDENGAELAITSGAWDYIEKAANLRDIQLSMERALEYRRQKIQYQAPFVLKREGIIGSSESLTACLDQLSQAAQSDVNTLIIGETGTGKELFAQAIHRNSTRSDGQLVVVDCAALPDTIVESILFGHEKGAFTGADQRQSGLIGQAHNGTLFLDEIGELPLPVQKRFLRVLQEKRFRPLGAKSEIECDFRLVAATHRDLNQMVEKGTFRKDLLFRVKAITISLPPLRERVDDIREIVRFLAIKICNRSRLEEKGFSESFFQALEAYDWPGNVRELANAVDGAIAAAFHEPILFETHLPNTIRTAVVCNRIHTGKAKARHHAESYDSMALNLPIKMSDFIFDQKTRYLKALIKQTKADMASACEISGLSRSQLYRLLSTHQISKNTATK